MSEATTEKSVLKTLFFNNSYEHMNTLVRHYKNKGVLFSEAGKMRLANIAGHLVGLYHGEQKDMAIKMAESIDGNLNRLCYNSRNVELAIAESTSMINTVVEAPAAKVILHDDGTFGGFSVGWYRPVAPKIYETKVKEARQIKNDTPDKEFNKIKAEYYTTAELARRMLNITERVDPHARYSDELTEHKYVADYGSVQVYYTYSHPGGLLYHGPGGGENFAVTLENNALWSIHT